MYAFADKVKFLQAVEVLCFVNKMPLRNHWHCKTEKKIKRPVKLSALLSKV